MSFVGKSVYTIWGGTVLRFGNITEEKMENRWKYVRVDWKDDEAYDKAAKWKGQMRNIEYPEANLEWYRVDKINIFEPHKMISTIAKVAIGSSDEWNR